MILDYSDYISRKAGYGVGMEYYTESYNSLISMKDGWCPFCKKKAKSVYIASRRMREEDFGESEELWICKCGWWETKRISYSHNTLWGGANTGDISINTAILRRFNDNDNAVPVESLREYIIKKPEVIYNIHHKKMEELVASVFREYYNCDVYVVGKSHDGGIDLILIDSDNPTVVQVKRRTSATKIEPVSSIRELLGATLLAQKSKCMFVTTAEHFSAPAINAAKFALKRAIVQRFELIDFQKLSDILHLCCTNNMRRWEKILVSSTWQSSSFWECGQSSVLDEKTSNKIT